MSSTQLQKELLDACYAGDEHKAAVCLEKGASLNEPDERKYYPLHMACQEGHLNVVKLLIKSGAILDLREDGGKGEVALFRAVGAGRLGVVEYLIKEGCNVNARRGEADGDTPLHTTCAWGRFKEAQALVNAGADVNALDDENHPPIYYAVANAHPEIAEFLIKNGAKPTSI